MKDKKILYGIIGTFVFLLSIGLTYAYFSVTTTVVGERNDIKASVGTLSILYTDGPEIVARNIQPGWTTTKTVKIKNTGTLKAYYSLLWDSITNEITNDELILSAKCTSDIGTCDNVTTQVADENLVYGRPIEPNEEQTYLITILFKEIGSTQNYNQDKNFNGVLKVVDAIESNTIVGQLLDSNGDPIDEATIEMHSVLRTGTTDTNGYFEIRGVEVGNHEITVKDSTDTIIATDSLSITSGDTLGVVNKDITNITDKGVLNTTIKLNNTNGVEEINIYPSLKDKILSDNTVYPDNVSSTFVSSETGIDFSSRAKTTNGQGLYTNNKLEDGKNTYFRGGSYCAYTGYIGGSSSECVAAGGTWSDKNCSLNKDRSACSSLGFTYYDLKNNVTFAGHSWKIIRIDENNNIRMVLADDSVDTVTFNTNFNDNAYIGYMYGTVPSTSYENAHTNEKNSEIKAATDSWYSANLINYKNYLSDAGYCNDRAKTSGLGYGESNGTVYNTYTRNYPDSVASPRLSISEGCSNSSRDLFTTNNSIIGNKVLTYPIGLITTDEARYAGMIYMNGMNNFINYLKFDSSYWTMSPMEYVSWGVARVYRVDSYGDFYYNFTGDVASLRVSISLKSSTSVINGQGTYDDPYVIE